MPLHSAIEQFLADLPDTEKELDMKTGYPERRKKEALLEEDLSPRTPVYAVEDCILPGPAGDIRIRFYTPNADGPYPLLLYFHGGGWVFGNLGTEDEPCRQIALNSGWKVGSVDYRLAPENPFPHPLIDCLAALNAVRDNAEALGIKRGHIAVGGASAGGNLAAAVALWNRDAEAEPLAGQVLIYPAVDVHRHEAPRYRSYEACSEYGLSSRQMSDLWEMYLQKEIDDPSGYACPIRSKDLGRLPKALVATAGFDPLRDEGKAYAERLREAGVPTTLKHYDSMNHAFNLFFEDLEETKDLYRTIGEFLRQLS